jgi:hypothetical protein
LRQEFGRLLPEWTDAPFIAFSVQAYPRLRPEFQVFDLEIRQFLHPAAGVVQHQQECAVTKGAAALGRQLAKERRDFVSIEKAGFGRGDAFARDRCDLLRDCETLGHAPPEKLKERMQDRQPVVACPPVIVADVFEMLEEPQDAIERQRVEGDLRKPTRHIVREEGEKETQGISMGLDGGRPKALLEREFVGEERMQQGAKRGRIHSVTSWISGSTERSNR